MTYFGIPNEMGFPLLADWFRFILCEQVDFYGRRWGDRRRGPLAGRHENAEDDEDWQKSKVHDASIVAHGLRFRVGPQLLPNASIRVPIVLIVRFHRGCLDGCFERLSLGIAKVV